jgi:hypothetical protein
LTEPDLILELSELVGALHGVGYQVRIGIDELDKLNDAANFLTGIKALFTIRDCSFILTISENAFSQFARRGMPIRDVIDSSLDSVTTVHPLTLEESRRLIRARLSVDYSEKVSDTQILLCYCLAGGLPREFLRFCRQVGAINSKIGGDAKLAQVVDLLFRTEIISRIDGVRFALQSREEKDTAVFIAQLELIDIAAKRDKTFGLLSPFLSSDRTFTRLCLGEIGFSDQDELLAANNMDWIRDSRRQLFSYLYFVETIRSVLGLLDQSGGGSGDSPQTFIDACEVLADARRRLEMDASAGWRRTTVARRKLELSELPARDSSTTPRRLVDEVTHSIQRLIKKQPRPDGAPSP